MPNYRITLNVNDYSEIRIRENDPQAVVNVRTKDRLALDVSDALKLYGLSAEIHEVVKARS